MSLDTQSDTYDYILRLVDVCVCVCALVFAHMLVMYASGWKTVLCREVLMFSCVFATATQNLRIKYTRQLWKLSSLSEMKKELMCCL